MTLLGLTKKSLMRLNNNVTLVGYNLTNKLKFSTNQSDSTTTTTTTTTSNDKSIDNTCDKITKKVFISQSNDIFTNLALEDWIYRNYDLKKQNILLFYINNPCIVIGRHQNPWLEINFDNLKIFNDKLINVPIVRRNSGGGTVYHDRGNLNLSFLTAKQDYNRKYNLNIITKALYRQYNLKSLINQRDDIIVNNDYKVSGTAAKLGRPNAYHHCTLLVNTNKQDLSLALQRKEMGITTNATESTRSLVKNLSDFNQQITIDSLINAIGYEYLRTDENFKDGGYEQVEKQNGFQLINPTNNWYPGLNVIINEFKNWEWIFGKTPSFIINRLIKAPKTLIGNLAIEFADKIGYNINNNFIGDKDFTLNLNINVKNGIVNDIKLQFLNSYNDKFINNNNENHEADVISNIKGTRFHHKVVDEIIHALGCTSYPLQINQENNVAATQ